MVHARSAASGAARSRRSARIHTDAAIPRIHADAAISAEDRSRLCPCLTRITSASARLFTIQLLNNRPHAASTAIAQHSSASESDVPMWMGGAEKRPAAAADATAACSSTAP